MNDVILTTENYVALYIDKKETVVSNQEEGFFGDITYNRALYILGRLNWANSWSPLASIIWH